MRSLNGSTAPAKTSRLHDWRTAVLAFVFWGGWAFYINSPDGFATGLTFGMRQVVVTVGRNKIVSDLDTAMRRIKERAAPMNAIRHASQTPCVKAAGCMDCKSPQRICNVWNIVEKAFPAGRITVILINQDLGL
jgi:hypothetical protein